MEDLRKAEELLEEATPADTTELEEALENTKTELKTFKDKEKETREEAEEATESAKTANETSSEKEAIEAKARTSPACS
ncbi:MAG: hypothetical protein K6E16_04720 [Lachnospiraceae bacterium]|nr:hypothetical protein [Lachnospiraceae bacterium]